jgi:3-deoxy-7-phosphoheptulonate synthase
VILVLKPDTKNDQVERAVDSLARLGLNCQVAQAGRLQILVIADDVSTLPSHLFSQIPNVEKIIRVKPQASLCLADGKSAVKLGSVQIGGGRPVVIAGPCSVEGESQLFSLARRVADAGASALRGGAFKPRTSPYDFQGLGKEALALLKDASLQTGLPVVSEVMSAKQIEIAEPFVDMFQIGARNMYNYELLKEVGQTRRPVLLKRAMSATIQELLGAAEYIMLGGNFNVVLCERGIRTFETHTRNTLDLASVAALKTMTSLPVIVDPSHATGRPELIAPMARAAIACGADGLMIEVHEDPQQAMSDGEQAITPSQLAQIVADANRLYEALQPSRIVSSTPAAAALSANQPH